MRAAAVAGTGALLGGTAVLLGAFAAHALDDVLEPASLATFETAVRYQMYHGLALLAAAGLGTAAVRAAPWLLSGSLIFSGSLYLLALTGTGWLGAIAPVGGTLQLIGWALLAMGLFRRSEQD